VNNILI